MSWIKLCKSVDLNLQKTLLTGQTFTWTVKEDVYYNVFGGCILGLTEFDGYIHYKLETNTQISCDIPLILHKYFQLDNDMHSLYKDWAKDENFLKVVGSSYNGIRILAQNPFQTILQFICSQNNNIKRITSLVQKLSSNYGEYVGEVEGTPFFNFPTIETLAKEKDLENQLRLLGFGYRAKYIAKTVNQIQSKPEDWFQMVQGLSYIEAKEELLTLHGIGPKVADCILLFSFGKTSAIPVDTHVWQIARRDYKMKLGERINSKVYAEIGLGFYKIFGEYCGWAHTLLFVADLKSTISDTKLISKKRKIEE